MLVLTPVCSWSADAIPTDAEQATGLEKKEHDAMLTGTPVLLNINFYCYQWSRCLAVF